MKASQQIGVNQLDIIYIGYNINYNIGDCPNSMLISVGIKKSASSIQQNDCMTVPSDYLAQDYCRQ